MNDTTKPGDIVRLVSDGPPMTVTAVDSHGAACAWFEGSLLRRKVLPLPALVKETRAEVDNARIEQAVFLAKQYGMIDGEHHKQWVIDQMCREILGGDYELFFSGCEWNEGVAP